MKDKQVAAALEKIYGFVQEGKVLGPFPGRTRYCPLTGHPPCFYAKTKPGNYRGVLNASYNRGGPSINDCISDYSTAQIDVKTSLYPALRTTFMSRIDLTRAFKKLFHAISQSHLLATMVDDRGFIEVTMFMGLRNTCKLFEEDFMKAFVKGLVHHHPDLFTDKGGWLINKDDI